MTHDDLSNFYYVTHVDNLESMLKVGLLCRNVVSGLLDKWVDISDSGVQSRRSQYHGHVPLYVADNTPSGLFSRSTGTRLHC